MRTEKRQQVGRPARIEVEGGNIIACRIANLSPGGALLLVSESEWLPPVFDLVDVFANSRRTVRVAWAFSARAGVRFLTVGLAPNRKSGTFGKRVCKA